MTDSSRSQGGEFDDRTAPVNVSRLRGTGVNRPLEFRDPGWLLLVAGLVGLASAFALTVEKFALLQDPSYVPACSINALLSCTGVMTSEQAEAFGFPNPLLGLVGFGVVATIGASVLAGGTYRRWFWWAAQVGVSGAFVFVHWLIWQSVFEIKALCPYCLVVWAVVAPIFWYTTLRNVFAAATARPRTDRFRRFADRLQEFHAVPLTAWYAVVLVVLAVQFWDLALSLVD